MGDTSLSNERSPGWFKPPRLSDAWIAELDRREAEYVAGRVELIDNEEVFARLRAHLREGTRKSEETTG